MIPAYLEQLHASRPQGRDATLAWGPLRFLSFYRLILAGSLTTIFFLTDTTPLGREAPLLFAATGVLYTLFALAAGFAARLHWPAYGWQTGLQVLVDILAITLLMHASGGLPSGLSILLVVAVAAGSLLVPGRLAFLFAAVATLAVFGQYGVAYLQGHGIPAGGITQSGLLGAAFFATAAMARMLALRLRESEELAEQRGVDLANMQELNERIVQRLHSGIVVVDPEGQVRLMNRTAWMQLGMPPETPGRHIAEIFPELHRHLRTWCENPDWAPPILRPEGSDTGLIPKFTRLGTHSGVGAIISLEDSSALAEQAQQMKLASLGRLTASIAHEIRNPLGAISHAAQLLAESTDLDAGDQRLVQIVRNHAQRMNGIIENVLQLSRRRQNAPQRLELGSWLEHFLAEFNATLHTSSGQIQLQGAGEVRAEMDPSHLHQILWNLLQNALEHGGRTDQPVRVRINIGYLEAGGKPFIEVLDNGPGITPEARENIFEPFFTTAPQGTGLGLYIARELCETNQARLRYDALPSGGSCFRIELPRVSEQ
jgi:two-component system sensor histidine kinase PilS (NtrC family)